MKIRARAILIIVVTNSLILLIGILTGSMYVRKNIEDYIESDMMVVAEIANRYISAELHLLRTESGDAAGSLVGAEPSAVGGILKTQLRQYHRFIGAAILDRGGEVIAAAGDTTITSALLENASIQRAFSGETAFTSTVPIPGGVALYLAVPISGRADSILILELDGMYFSDLVSSYTIWETGHIFIDDSEGTIIANTRSEWVQNRQNFVQLAENDPQYQEVASAVEKGMQGERGIDYYDIDGVSRICAYHPILDSDEGWFLGIVAPLSESPVQDLEEGLLLIAFIIFTLNVLAAVVASQFIKKPFENIAALKEKAEYALLKQKKMTDEIEYRDHLQQMVNKAIDLLLRSEPDDFSKTFVECMGMMAVSIGADRMYLYKNHIEDGRRYNTRLYEWAKDGFSNQGDSRKNVFLCEGESFLLKDKLGRGESIHCLTSELPPLCLNCIDAQDTLSVMVIPIVLRDVFWGFVGFHNCQSERLFTENEESVMRSGSLLFASAFLRNEYMLKLRDTSGQLENALAEAKEANNAKSSFLARMSHEIRTPLNAVVGLSELALDDERLSGGIADKIEKIHASGMTILSIVNDILDISKIESGKFELIPIRYDIPSLINDAVTLNIVRIGEKPIIFRLSVDENLPSALIGDDLRVKQIFNNLLSNAFKYTNTGTVEWHVGFERKGDSVWLISSVVDTGIGMKPEDVQKLFGDYYQATKNASYRVEGTGLGLSITKSLLEMMDGSITVESEYGKGSSFHVRLRQEFASGTPIGKPVAENLMGLRYTFSKRVSNQKLVRMDLSYAQVLVVDDIETNLDVVRGMMKPYGVKVDCATSGKQAIEMIRLGETRYSAIFMDHMMPEMDGIEATHIIREEIGTEYARDIPIIALTANAIVGNEAIFLSHGFQDFISKPIDMARLDAVMRRWVRDKDLEKECLGNTENDISPPEDGIGVNEDGRKLLKGVYIEGIDIEKALERFGGSEEVFLDVLRSYATNTKPLLTRLAEYLQVEDLESYTIAIHGVKGSSYGISAQQTGRMAAEQETVAKADDIREVQVGHPIFSANLAGLLKEIDKALLMIDAAAQKHVAPAPDPILLTQLRSACAAFDMDGVDAAMEELESFRYETGGELIEWLRVQVNNMNFEVIVSEKWPVD